MVLIFEVNWKSLKCLNFHSGVQLALWSASCTLEFNLHSWSAICTPECECEFECNLHSASECCQHCQGLSSLETPKNKKWLKFGRATVQNVKVIKNWFGRFLKLRMEVRSAVSLCMAFFGLFETIFEILRVLAFCEHKKI